MSLTDLGSHSLASETDVKRDWRVRQWWPYLLLTSLLALMFAALAALNLDLGFVGDVLAYEYHYDRLGIQGGMNWLVNVEWQRHLLASIYSAPIHLLFPGQSAAWYAIAFLLHFANAVMCFLLVDTIFRGQRRWIAFSTALIFAFHTLQIVSHFEYPTGSHRKAALFLALLSLWLYLQWVRRGRQNRWWRELSLAAYIIAVASYEQTAFFFLLHPIIAYFEDRHSIRSWSKWLFRVVLDSLWYPLFFGVYLFILYQLFINNEHIVFSFNRILEQIAGALRTEFAPSEFLSRLTPAFQGGWLLLTLGIGTAMLVILWLWRRYSSQVNAPQHETSRSDLMISELVEITLLGVMIIVVTIVAVAPTTWLLSAHPRLYYPAAAGFGMLVTGGLALLLQFVPNATLRNGVFALGVAFLVSTGTTRTFQVQQDYLHQNQAREAVKEAVLQTVPEWNNTLPYLLIVSDAHPSRDLALHAQDVKFPIMFDMMYGVDGIAADAIYPDVPASFAPAPELPGSRYNGPYIVVEPEGIYSPLRRGIPIDPDRLVIIYYDSLTHTAQVLDELPADVLATANIIERAPIQWRTNYDLLNTP
jgi:hypothetical protein